MIFDHRCSDRQIRARNSFGDVNNVLGHIPMLMSEHLASPARPVNDLVDVQEQPLVLWQILATSGRYAADGTAPPTPLMIGSRITPAMVSGPSPSMVVSKFFTYANAHEGLVRPNGHL
jgi:hypothetical protein